MTQTPSPRTWEPSLPREGIERYRDQIAEAVIRGSASAIVGASTQGTIVLWNPAAELLLGWAADEALGRPMGDFVSPDGLAHLRQHLASVLSGTSLRQLRLTALRKDGSLVPVSVTRFPIVAGDGATIGAANILEDDTERRLAEAQLLSARDFYMSLLDDFPVPIWRSGRDGRYDYLNEAWLTFTGRTMPEELGEGWTDGIHPEDRAHWRSTFRGAFDARRPFEMEYRLRRHDGQYRLVVDVGRPYQSLDGAFAGYIGTC